MPYLRLQRLPIPMLPSSTEIVSGKHWHHRRVHSTLVILDLILNCDTMGDIGRCAVKHDLAVSMAYKIHKGHFHIRHRILANRIRSALAEDR